MASNATQTAERMARRLRVSTDQLAMLADFCEQHARNLIDQGVAEDAALEAAAQETIDLATSLGVKL